MELVLKESDSTFSFGAHTCDLTVEDYAKTKAVFKVQFWNTCGGFKGTDGLSSESDS